MRIHGKNLISAAQEKGVTVERLADAVARTGLSRPDAESAVRNWMGDRDHPRCKSEDIRNLAAALGVEVSRIARFESVYRFSRGSPRKAKLLVDLIRGKRLLEAETLLRFNIKRAAVEVRKALRAAAADAQQANADENALVISQSRVDDGPRMKRFHQKDRGRAHRILKRMAHIRISLEEATGGGRRR